MRKIVLATGNPGKVREFSAALAGSGVEIVPQSAFAVPEVEETGLSFVENALIKARHAARHTGLPALADDSGLVVDALSGAPGIYSARYAGPGADDRANNSRLLAELQGVAEAQRSARFACALVLLRDANDPLPLLCQQTWEGIILSEPRGSGGFGYDPLFFVPTEGCTSAELDLARKNQLSHRGRALAQLARELKLNPVSAAD